MTIWRGSTARGALLLLMSDGEWHYTYDMMRTAQVRAGLMYRVLGDLEDEGRIEAKWADLEPGRKYRRRLYRRTG